jgi:DNA polymerase/3'-5' exonuclease PolX
VEVNSEMTDVKPQVVAAFEILLNERKASRDRWRARAYQNALIKLKYIPQITSIDDVKNVRGFGDSLLAKVEEILRSGHSDNFAQESKLGKAVKELITVHGIGEEAANVFAERHKIYDVEQLRKAHETGKVKLTHGQILGLKHYSALQNRIPREEIQQHELYLTKVLSTIDKRAQMSILGSYRRGASKSGDIDVLIAHDDDDVFQIFIKVLVQQNYLFDQLTLGSVKYNGFCHILHKNSGVGARGGVARRIDILYTTPEEFPFAQLYFTGSKVFNMKMRSYAHRNGYSLNQKALTYRDTGQKVEKTFYKEEDIFDYFGFKYVPPHLRTEDTNLVLELEHTTCESDRALKKRKTQ